MKNGTIYSGNIPVVKIENDKILILDNKRAPLYFLNNKGSFEKWLEQRAIDAHRTNSRILKKALRLEDVSDVETVLSVNAVTLTDNYWFKDSNDTLLTWENVKFKKNDFSMLALKGDLDDFSKRPSRTPELTSIGSYEKCWKLENNKWWMYKSENNNEIFSELFIYNLGKKLNFNMAIYEYDNGYIKTPDFTNGNKVNYEAIYSLVGDIISEEQNFDTLKKIDINLAEEYLKILYLDCICFNVDRHNFNYGVLRSVETGEILSLAPNFDNNIAFLYRNFMPEDISRKTDRLIEDFIELLDKNESAIDIFTSINIPCITENIILECFEEIPNEVKKDINLQSVKTFILNGFNRINEYLKNK